MIQVIRGTNVTRPEMGRRVYPEPVEGFILSPSDSYRTKGRPMAKINLKKWTCKFKVASKRLIIN